MWRVNNHKLLIAAIIIGIFAGSFYGHKLRAPKRNYSDFHCFYTAGKRILNGENIYVLRDKETAEFRYAPVFAVLMSALALTDENNADTLWYAINFILLILSFVFLKKLVIPQALDFKPALVLYTLTILGALRFILHNFDAGQSNILMLASLIIGLYYISRKKEALGGAILAFSVMIKYTPLIFIPYFIFRRKFKLSLIVIASIIIYLILPSLLVGLKANFLYLKNLIPFLTQSTILDQFTVLDPKNQSLYSMIQRLFTRCVSYFHAPPMPFQSWNLPAAKINLIFIASATIIYLSILCAPKREQTSQNRYNNVDYALLLICAVLFNLNAWAHNYIFLIPAYFIIAHYLIKNKFSDIFVSILLFLSYLLNIITLKPVLGKTLAYKIHFYSPFTISALVIFLALLKIKFSKNLTEP